MKSATSMRTAIAFILVIATGPLVAVAALWLGCNATSLLGAFCGHNAPLTLIVLVALGWIGTAALLAAFSGRRAEWITHGRRTSHR
jgi:hypothetical protein